MRKRTENPTLLFEAGYLKFPLTVADTGKVLGYDFVRKSPIRDVISPFGEDAECFPDLQVTATFDATSTTWQVTLSPGGTKGGIMVSDQLLYEAPADGYGPSYSFVPEDRGDLKDKYVYLKSRDPAIYTRLEIDYINANSEFFRLNGKAVTNPYGERNLEAATDLPIEIKAQLMEEVRAAFRANQRPTRPDLPKLIQEFHSKSP